MPENQREAPDHFEDRLTAALRDAGDGFQTDRTALVTGGQARGRRARVRRRAGVLGGAAGIALIGVGGAVLLPQGAGPDTRRSVAASPDSGRPSPSATPSGFSARELFDTLEGLLPPGEVGQGVVRGSDAEEGPYVQVVYDDGKGAAALGVGFARVEPGGEQAGELTECPDPTFAPYDDCTTDRSADGSVLRVLKGYEYPDRRVDTKLWTADLVTAEGQHISVSEWNSPAQKDRPVSREEPPLSAAELKELVSAEVWRRVADVAPESGRLVEGGGPGATPSAVSGEAVGDTLAALLPDGLEVVRRGGEGEFAYAVVDDGEGESLVQVNVQHGMNDVADQLYGSAETLADGTRVTTRQGSGDDRVAGVVMWTADTLRAGEDGFRVVVSAFNNSAVDAEPSRAEPALGLEQLRKIALSTEWDALR
ncbi:hypothetical protein J7I94_01765 [Streptomyces sp. ISL-12]|uniref:hypothetical protein n=1 Tax=Streptomyces sp. ISL-12 TaxID=2819177 RepID=UPI001BE96137|nr:hypothetical protein [Streptomyces sp. ISL-12]MBT2409298.1 hypothetical protein [Streptomyces sp. ISL-12]